MLHELRFYESVATREALRAQLFLKAHGELVEDVASSLMLPAGFSPWR